MRRFLPAALVVALCVLTGCRSEESSAPSGSPAADGTIKVSLQLNWTPEAEHGGFYAALVHGDYADEGLDVEILPGGPGIPVIKLVDLGNAMFGVTNADDVLLQNAQGTDVVAVLAPIQTSPRCIMVHASSGIESLDQLGRVSTLAMNSSKPFAMFLKQKVDLSNVRIVDGAAIPKFVDDATYAQQAYIFSEPFVAEKAGSDPRSLLVSDLGFNPYTSVLIATSQTVRENPELVRKLVRASQRGWEKYLADPSEANAAIHALNPAMESDILAYGATAMKPLCAVAEPDAPLGHMTAERWQTLHAQMIQIEALKPDAVAVEKAFTLEFLRGE